ncbi:MAG: hypothetical protein EOO61_14400, partial [Hymenobacter sp.]
MSNRLYYERNLPHRLPPGSDIFLTFRLADSLPAKVLFKLQAQFTSADDEPSTNTYAQQRRYFGRFDELLDASQHGPTWLQEPAIAEIIAGSLRY